MSGNGEAFNEMLSATYHGGKIVLGGLLPKNTFIDWDNIIFKGLHVKGVYGREMYETWYKMDQLIKSGLDLSKIITHKFQPLALMRLSKQELRSSKSSHGMVNEFI